MAVTIVDDVLDTIFYHCDLSSLAILNRLSSHFRALSQPHLLHSVSFEKDVIQLVSFLTPITNQDGGAFGLGRHVRRFEISAQALSKNRRWHISDSMTPAEMLDCTDYTETIPLATWAPMVTSALRSMPNLHVFVLRGLEQVEELIHHSPLFISNLLACDGLKTLSLDTVGPELSKMLGKSCSILSPSPKIETLSVSGGELEGNILKKPLRICPQDGLGCFLRHTRHHLTSLSLRHINLDAFSTLDSGLPVLFPSLHTLDLGDCRFPLSWLVAAAPRIHTLSLDCSELIHSSEPFPRPAFPHLVRLNAVFHHVVALTRSNALSPHNLRSLRLGLDWGKPHTDDTIESFAIARAASRLKSVTFSQPFFRPLSWWQGFAQALPPLRFLNISLRRTSADELHTTVSKHPQQCVHQQLTVNLGIISPCATVLRNS
jgi:hypothetical protein